LPYLVGNLLGICHIADVSVHPEGLSTLFIVLIDAFPTLRTALSVPAEYNFVWFHFSA
jgi:hypothetical protein